MRVYDAGGLATSVDKLASVQEKFNEDYTIAKEFSNNPKAIDELMGKLGSQEQNMLLKLLLKSGNIGKKAFNLFDMSSGQQKELKFS